LKQFEGFQLALALQDTWDLIRAVNQYIVKREPWTLSKQAGQRQKLEITLYHAADALRVTAALIDPVMPGAAARIRQMLGVHPEQWSGLKAATLAAGTRLGTIEPLFPRIEKTVEELRAMTGNESSTLGGPAAQPAETPATPAATSAPAPPAPATAATDSRIPIDDFMKVELRVAKILEAEAVPKSKKLIKMKVNAGEAEPRTIVAGIAEAYQAEQLVGRTIVIVANLKPAKLMGIESNGMVLAASPEGGLPTLISVDESLPAGARVR